MRGRRKPQRFGSDGEGRVEGSHPGRRAGEALRRSTARDRPRGQRGQNLGAGGAELGEEKSRPRGGGLHPASTQQGNTSPTSFLGGRGIRGIKPDWGGGGGTGRPRPGTLPAAAPRLSEEAPPRPAPPRRRGAPCRREQRRMRSAGGVVPFCCPPSRSPPRAAPGPAHSPHLSVLSLLRRRFCSAKVRRRRRRGSGGGGGWEEVVARPRAAGRWAAAVGRREGGCGPRLRGASPRLASPQRRGARADSFSPLWRGGRGGGRRPRRVRGGVWGGGAPCAHLPCGWARRRALPDPPAMGALVAFADERNHDEPRKARQAAGPSTHRWQGRSRLSALPSGLRVPTGTPGLARGVLKSRVGSSLKYFQLGLNGLRGSCAAAGISRVTASTELCSS